VRIYVYAPEDSNNDFTGGGSVECEYQECQVLHESIV